MTAPTLTSDDPELAAFADEVGGDDPVAVEGGRTRWEVGGRLDDGVRLVTAPSGLVEYAPAEMIVRVRAGTTTAELGAALTERGQRCALPERGGTVGGSVAVGENDLLMAGRGRVRDSVLQVRYVSAEGRLVTGGGPTVKNVTGFDLPRLMVGSLGTLGLVAEVILRTNPVPAVSRWLRADDVDPFACRSALRRPGGVLWDGTTTWVLLEGHPPDLDDQQAALGPHGAFTPESSGPRAPGAGRWSLAPAALRRIDELDTGAYLAAVGVGLVLAERSPGPRELTPELEELHRRAKANFDPTGRLNPGRDPARR